MRYKVKTKEKLSLNREVIANIASQIVEARGIFNDRKFSPYKPNEHDDSFWTLDQGNDWKIKFHETGDSFELFHRYENDHLLVDKVSVKEAVQCLAGLLAYKLNGKVVYD